MHPASHRVSRVGAGGSHLHLGFTLRWFLTGVRGFSARLYLFARGHQGLIWKASKRELTTVTLANLTRLLLFLLIV